MIRKIDDQAKNRDLDRDQNGDRKTLKKRASKVKMILAANDSESDGSDESFELRPKQIRFSFGCEEPATHVHAGGIGEAENFISDD